MTEQLSSNRLNLAPDIPSKVLFIGWMLSEYGGLETRLDWAVRVAKESGFVPEVHLGRPIPAGSQIQRDLRDITVGSAVETWEQTLGGRAVRTVARVKHLLSNRTLPTEAQLARAGHKALARLIDGYWPGRGRHMLESADLVHLIGPPHPYMISAMETARSMGIPVIYQSVHAVTEEYAQNKWRRDFIDKCNQLDLILISHGDAAEDFRTFFGYTGETLTLSQSAYLTESQLLALNPIGVDNSRPVVVGALCRFDQVKGLDVLINAFATVAKSDQTSILRIGGSGPEDSKLKDLTRQLGIADRVTFVGFVKDRVSFYEGIDIFAISSHMEGGPVAGVEAMAAGRAIVSTDVGAMRERLHDERGMLVPAGDISDFAEALAKLIDEPELRSRMGSMARERYQSDYSESRQRADLVSTWKKLVRLSSRSR